MPTPPFFYTSCFPASSLVLTKANTDISPDVASPVEGSTSNHIEVTSSGKTADQELYEHRNCSFKVLVLLCHELLDSDGNPLFEEITVPWKSMKVSSYYPTSNEFEGMIERRWNAFASAGQSTFLPLPEQWSLPKELMWLNNNPITNDGDIAFLVETINK